MRALNSSRLLIAVLLIGGACAAVAANLGLDDQQVSFTGPAGSTVSDAVTPAVAFDENNQRYLLVWSADETDSRFRIMGRLLSGAAGAPLGPAFVISTTGGTTADHLQPAVAFSPAHDQYLVVWSNDAFNPGAFEITGQLVTADGQLAGAAQRLSSMGTDDTDFAFDAVTPDVVHHPFLDRFVVAWAGDTDDTADLLDGRFEIYGQLVDAATGLQVGADDFRISFSLPGPVQNDILAPALAADPASDRWYVAFEGDVSDDPVHSPEIWIYGGTADVPDGSAFNVTATGGDWFDELSAQNPDLAWVPGSGELVVVWDAEADGANPQGVYGRRCLPDGTLLGSMFPVSGGAGTLWGDLREAVEPAIAVDPVSGEWFITWRGDLNDGAPDLDHEVWGRRFDAAGAPVDAAAFALSAMDPTLGPVAGAGPPVVAVNSALGYKLVAWSGDLDTTPGDEHEIFSQSWSDDAFSAADGPVSPAAFSLHGAAPNPFNPQTTISFDLPRGAPVNLHVYDAAGRLVRTLLAGSPGVAGRNSVVWNGQDDGGRPVASGVYLYRLETPTHGDLGRMTLIK